MRARTGFTLLEVMVTLLILAILAGIAVPAVSKFQSEDKRKAYDAERIRLQLVMDSYFNNPANTTFLGKRQYPLLGRNQTNQSALVTRTTSTPLADDGEPLGAGALWNPLGGIRGADLSSVWSDGNGDGERTRGPGSPETWTTVAVTKDGVTYYTDPRYYFIDFEELLRLTAGLLIGVPSSASLDNRPPGITTPYEGHYTWYVDQNGRVQSLSYRLPSITGHVTNTFP